MDGKYILYNDNGNKMVEVNYKDGVEDGRKLN